MKRTTIYLDPDLEFRLKLEARKSNKPVAELIREAVREKLAKQHRQPPPGAGVFDSGYTDTAERAEELLAEGFGLDSLAPDQREAFLQKSRLSRD
ncbi:CopG family transcriptional regulator [uncultured Meiothermus sp.]|uniref:ribbon-helix-helix domain-containing protein n=1 Tax=uncultured Meiothermus sp. TaxID=157471 RepID=UPI00260CB317|nr:CopG family transcriptional regulator [uncultured Meiothermus sp.]